MPMTTVLSAASSDGGGINMTAVLVAVLGAGGLGAALRELFAGIGKLARGVSAKESTRKDDLVQARDNAIARADQAEEREDAHKENLTREERNRRRAERRAAHMEFELIRAGLADKIPQPEILEDTITPAQLRIIQQEGQQ